jgi:hypothetical protein
VADCVDECPAESRKSEAGVCGCDLPDNDYDSDGTPDCIAQGGELDPPITSWHVALILVEFSDTSPSIKAQYPQVKDFEERFFAPDGRYSEYFKAMSFGHFTGMTGEVFGPFEHPRTLQDMLDSGDYVAPDYPESHLLNTGSAIQIPGFDPDAYDVIHFLAFDDYSWSIGGLTGEWTVRINDQDLVNAWVVLQTLQIGVPMHDPQNDPVNGWTEPFFGSAFVPLPVGEVELDHSAHGLSSYDHATLHELVHSMGILTHANATIGDETPLKEPPMQSSEQFDREEYGDEFSLMGQSSFSMALNTAYRDFLGWYDETSQVEILTAGMHQVELGTSDSSGIRSVEIRIPHRVNPQYKSVDAGPRLNAGYFLEVRDPTAKWDAPLSSPSIDANTEGVIVTFNDGATSWLVDASPSPYLDYSGEFAMDLRDIVLHPGMTFETPDVTIACTGKTPAGLYQLEIEVQDNW